MKHRKEFHRKQPGSDIISRVRNLVATLGNGANSALGMHSPVRPDPSFGKKEFDSHFYRSKIIDTVCRSEFVVSTAVYKPVRNAGCA